MGECEPTTGLSGSGMRGSTYSPALMPRRDRRGDDNVPGIVIIDDEPVLRMMFRHFLEDDGYTVEDAGSGKRGSICAAMSVQTWSSPM